MTRRKLLILGSMVALMLVTIALGPPPETLGDDARDLPAGVVTLYEHHNGEVVVTQMSEMSDEHIERIERVRRMVPASVYSSLEDMICIMPLGGTTSGDLDCSTLR